MRGRDEHGLELGRGDVDAALEQVAEELAVALGVGALGVGEVPTGPSVQKTVSIPPTRCTVTPVAGRPASRAAPVSSRRRYTSGSRSRRRTTRAAAVASGFPESVPAWYTGPAGASSSMTSARPPKAASGRPPPAIFPSTVRSGRDAVELLRPTARDAEAGDHLVEDEQGAGRVAEGASASRKPGAGGTTPMFPATGSTMTAARPSP